MPAAKYRPRYSLDIDAIRWDGTVAGATEVIDWVLSKGGVARYHDKRFTDSLYDITTGESREVRRENPVPPRLAVDSNNAGVEFAAAGDFVTYFEGTFGVADAATFTEEFELVPSG